MKIGDIVRSKKTGKLYRVLKKEASEIRGYTCEPIKREDSRYYFRESEVDVVEDDKVKNNISQYIAYLKRNGYIVKRWTESMEIDANECAALDKEGVSKCCDGCSCCVCLMQ